MKTLMAFCLGTFLHSLVFAAPLKIEITNVHYITGSDTSPVRIALFTAERWAQKKKNPDKQFEMFATATSISKEFDLAPGEYVFFLYHDLDNNNDCDSNIVGFPTEPFRFSNNFRLKMSRPTVAEIGFKVTDEGAVQTIQLTYSGGRATPKKFVDGENRGKPIPIK